MRGSFLWVRRWRICFYICYFYYMRFPAKVKRCTESLQACCFHFASSSYTLLVTVHQLQRRGQHIVICCGLHGIRLVEITLHSSLSFFMPNSLRSKPLRHLGLLRTTTCIEPTTFRRLIRHYRRPAPGMFRFSSGSARPAPSPPPPVRPFGWRW